MFAHFRALVFGCEFFWPAALCPLAGKLARLLMEPQRAEDSLIVELNCA